MDNQPSIYNGIVMRLKFFKYEVFDEDGSFIDYLTLKVISSINNQTNQFYTPENIPYGLYSIVVDKVCGEFLMLRKNLGELPDIDLTPVEKQIQEGDTSVTYYVEGVSSPEKRLDALISFLMTGRDDELIKYRRLAW